MTVHSIARQRISSTDEFHSIQEQVDNNIINLKITFHKEVYKWSPNNNSPN